MLQEQAESNGKRAQRPWELFSDRTVRWQLISVAIISSAMQLCGNDSVSEAVSLKNSDSFIHSPSVVASSWSDSAQRTKGMTQEYTLEGITNHNARLSAHL